MMKNVTFFLILVGYRCLMVPFGCICIMQGPSYPGKIVLVSIWYKNGIDLDHESGMQRFSHLDKPTEHRYLIGVTISTPMGTFFDAIVFV